LSKRSRSPAEAYRSTFRSQRPSSFVLTFRSILLTCDDRLDAGMAFNYRMIDDKTIVSTHLDDSSVRRATTPGSCCRHNLMAGELSSKHMQLETKRGRVRSTLAAILCTRPCSCARIRRSLMAELGRTTSTPAARPVIRRHRRRGDYIGEMKF